MKENKEYPDKRRHERYQVPERPDYSINLRRPDKKTFHNAVTANISYGGMMFISDDNYACGSKIETVIRFSEKETSDIILQGTVRWSEANPGCEGKNQSYCIGIQFDDLPEHQETEFRKFINTFIVNS